MLKESFIKLFERDLVKLKDEINLYKDESDLWTVKNEIKNSAGNLCLHLIGNLNHFIGAVLGKTDYVRNRNYEFAAKNIPRKDLIDQIEQTIKVVKETLSKISENDLKKDFPIKFNDHTLTIESMLLNIVTHLNYHLGQINYHRRLL